MAVFSSLPFCSILFWRHHYIAGIISYQLSGLHVFLLDPGIPWEANGVTFF